MRILQHANKIKEFPDVKIDGKFRWVPFEIEGNPSENFPV